MPHDRPWLPRAREAALSPAARAKAAGTVCRKLPPEQQAEAVADALTALIKAAPDLTLAERHDIADTIRISLRLGDAA